MTIFALIQSFLEAVTQYLKLKNQTAYFDILEKFDSRLDKLDKMRQTARTKPTTEGQNQAEEILSEIVEEKKKLAEFKKTFNKP
jgi:hypothetical protein